MGDILPFFNTVVENEITYYVIPANTRLFRGDIPADYTNPLSHMNGPIFFGESIDVARIYGLPFEYKTTNELQLLALDRSMDTIYNAANPIIKSILKKNYGYPDGYRNSDDDADKQLTQYICNTYGGYALDFMPTEGGGKFHREIILCDKTQVEFVKKVMISQAEENTIIDNQKIRRTEQERIERKKRQRRVGSTDNVISNNLPTALFGRDDKNFNIGSRTKSSRVNRSLFDQEDDEMDEEDNKPSSFAVNKLSFDSDDDDNMDEENKELSTNSVKILFEDEDDTKEPTSGGKRQQHKKKTMRRNKKNSKKRYPRRKTNSKRHIKKRNNKTRRK